MSPPTPPTPPTRGLRHFIFFHPDLGIGGAERLVVDAAVGLQNLGHKVTIFTSHCDPTHCFDEARDGTLNVRIRGNLLPASLCSRMTILFSILRQLHLLLQIYFTGELEQLNPDTFVIDQLSAGLPLLQYLWPAPGIIFYCHFPDMLLARGREQPLKRLYRLPFDALEEWSTSYAHAIAVNSEFTKGMVKKTMPHLATRDLRVVYPAIEIPTTAAKTPSGDAIQWPSEKLILSINRFERKKDIGLAIRAFAALPIEKRKDTRLVLAGGYDPRVPENVEYHQELCALADSLKLPHHTAPTTAAALGAPPPSESPILFLLSVSSPLKDALLAVARLLVYTPSHEHFGIVPLEAMGAGVPVLACNNGGPMETVLDGATGWLRDPTKEGEWTEVMGAILGDQVGTVQRRGLMAAAGKKRVLNFSVEELAGRLERIARDVEDTPRKRPLLTSVLNMVGIVWTFWLGLVVAKVLFQ